MSQIPAPTGSLWSTSLPITPADPHVTQADAKRLTGQNRRVLDLLQGGAKLDPRSAFDVGITRLAARIKDLRSHGFKINGQRDPVTKCSVYWIGEAQ